MSRPRAGLRSVATGQRETWRSRNRRGPERLSVGCKQQSYCSKRHRRTALIRRFSDNCSQNQHGVY